MFLNRDAQTSSVPPLMTRSLRRKLKEFKLLFFVAKMGAVVRPIWQDILSSIGIF